MPLKRGYLYLKECHLGCQGLGDWSLSLQDLYLSSAPTHWALRPAVTHTTLHTPAIHGLWREVKRGGGVNSEGGVHSEGV